MSTHLPKKFACKHCKRAFKKEVGLRDHMNFRHPDQVEQPIVSAVSKVPDWIVPICVECGGTGELCDGQSIYPHRPDLWSKSYYRCQCGAYCGCHPGTQKPLGYPCGEATRRARNMAHAAFDPLWKGREMTRARAYAWLARELKIEPGKCHIGMMTSEQARNVVELVREYHRKQAA